MPSIYLILNEKELSYANELQTLMDNMVRESKAFSTLHEYGEQGEIFVLRADQLREEEHVLLQTTARIVILSSRGTLAEQLMRSSHACTEVHPAHGFVRKSYRWTRALNRPDRPRIFQWAGRLADDGREYVIVMDKGQCTPAPWINVIANAELGFTVSELGSGYSWSLNSRLNQLTPWSNDPVGDPPGEMFYLRDEENDDLWSPTALPIRVDNAAYVVRHGQGYSRFEHVSHGIHSELLQFVSPDDPVKISSLTLKNISGRPRKLTVAAYVEWVLGASRTVTAPYVVSELDQATGALFAYNSMDVDFGQRIAFVDLAGRQASWTCNRTEFIGRNGTLDAPLALCQSKALKNRVGAGLDPCAALTTQIELAAGASVEVVFLLGQGNDRDHAGELVKRYRAADIQLTFAAMKQSWSQTLGKIQVKTPDRSLDLMLNGWLLLSNPQLPDMGARSVLSGRRSLWFS